MLESAKKYLELAHRALTTGQPNLASLYMNMANIHMAQSIDSIIESRDGGAAHA